MVAVLPAAGLGTRMRSLTGGSAKELLSVGGKPVIEHVLEEARQAGASEIVVISSLLKPDLNDWLKRQSGISLVYQSAPNGLGDALACYLPTEPALVLLPDTLFCGLAASLVLVDQNEREAVRILVEEVAADDRHRYGIVEVASNNRVHRIIEKPEPGATESRLAVAARYYFPVTFYRRLSEQRQKAAPGEFGVSAAIQAWIDEGGEVYAQILESGGARLDCGSPSGYKQAKEAFG
ncbi:MAG: sugar phosphate nucleotidyltransferase [Fimbriimonadaceae bacterium]